MPFAATGLQRWRGVRAVLAWEEAWSSRIGSCFKRSVFYVARSGESRGTYVPSLPESPATLKTGKSAQAGLL